METANRRKVIRPCTEEVYIDECHKGNIILTPNPHAESSPNLDPFTLYVIDTDIEALKKLGKLDSIEIVRASLFSLNPKCVKIEESKSK